MTKPCPFCGCTLTPMLDQLHQKTIAYNHFRVPATQPGIKCLFNGHSIGAEIIDRWELRAPVVYMQIVDDHPIFNLTGEGQPVDIDMINKTLAYYKDLAQ